MNDHGHGPRCDLSHCGPAPEFCNEALPKKSASPPCSCATGGLPTEVLAAFEAAGQNAPPADAVDRSGYSSAESRIIEMHYRRRRAAEEALERYDPDTARRAG